MNSSYFDGVMDINKETNFSSIFIRTPNFFTSAFLFSIKYIQKNDRFSITKISQKIAHQSKEIKQNCTRPKLILGYYDQSFISGREAGDLSLPNFEIS